MGILWHSESLHSLFHCHPGVGHFIQYTPYRWRGSRAMAIVLWWRNTIQTFTSCPPRFRWIYVYVGIYDATCAELSVEQRRKAVVLLGWRPGSRSGYYMYTGIFDSRLPGSMASCDWGLVSPPQSLSQPPPSPPPAPPGTGSGRGYTWSNRLCWLLGSSESNKYILWSRSRSTMHQSSVVEVVSAPALNKSRQVSSRDSWSNVRFSPFSTYHKTLSGVFWAKFTSAKKTSRKSLGWLTSLVTLCSSMLSRNIARSSLMILIRAFKPGTREAMMPHHGSAYCSANLDLNVLFSWWASRFQTTLRRFLPKIILFTQD